MILSPSEENKNRIVSLGISMAIFVLLLVFFIFFIIVTPNPPFPETIPGGGGSGMEFNIGSIIEGTGNVDPDNGIGEAVKVVESTEPVPTPPNSQEDLLTSDQGVETDVKKNEVKTTQQTVVIPVKPKEKTMAEKIREQALKNSGKSGGDGESGQAGNEGRPDGKPNTNGKGGTGGGDNAGKGDGDGDDTGPGHGPGPPGIGFSLKGRKMTMPPPISKDTKEEGTVVVEITVDREGNVIKTDANGRGTNTNSPILKAKARQAAKETKFNVSGEFEEQKGTITFVFKF